MNIAIIPARGGSKRIPNKNLIDFMGKPMISWTIEAAKKSGIFDRIVISTDDIEIAEIARKNDIAVPFLRAEAYDDFTPISKATIHAIKQSRAFWGEEYETVIQLMANCPMRGEQEIKDAYNNFLQHNFSFQLSCFRYGWMNPWWAMKLSESFLPTFLFPEASKRRSQDLADLYCPTGAIWIAKVKDLEIEDSFYGSGFRFFPIDWKSAVDIDDYDDLDFAKSIYHQRNNFK